MGVSEHSTPHERAHAPAAVHACMPDPAGQAAPAGPQRLHAAIDYAAMHMAPASPDVGHQGQGQGQAPHAAGEGLAGHTAGAAAPGGPGEHAAPAQPVPLPAGAPAAEDVVAELVKRVSVKLHGLHVEEVPPALLDAVSGRDGGRQLAGCTCSCTARVRMHAFRPRLDAGCMHASYHHLVVLEGLGFPARPCIQYTILYIRLHSQIALPVLLILSAKHAIP